MILVGNQRGHSSDLARHLMSPENERVELHELRGFASDTLEGAFNESYAISKGTRCRQHLFSLSLNPPPDAQVSTAEFEDAIAKAEKRLGLEGQPRAVVFHEKHGPAGLRRHCHAVWSRIDADQMKAVQLSFSKRKLVEVSKDLFIQHGWETPRGLIDRSERDPLNFSHAEWQQAKRVGKDAQAIKRAFQDAWALSDNKNSFAHALKERGYYLARGDRRGFVAVDAVTDEPFAVSKWAGVKTKALRERLGDEAALPSITEARAQIAKAMSPRMERFERELQASETRNAKRIASAAYSQTKRHKQASDALAADQQRRREDAAQSPKSGLRKGLLGLWDRLTGRHAKVLQDKAAKARQLEEALARDRARLEDAQRAEQRRLADLEARTKVQAEAKREDLAADKARFKAMRRQEDVRSPNRRPPNTKPRDPPPTARTAFETAADPTKAAARARYREERQAASEAPDHSRSPALRR